MSLEEIPQHYGGGKVVVADALWSRVVEQVRDHLPDVLTDLEDAHGDLMQIAFDYGTCCQAGDEPMLNYNLTTDEYESRT